MFDCIYNPKITKLLDIAKSKKSRIISGIELFINQAAVQFELWTNQEAPIKLMSKLLE